MGGGAGITPHFRSHVNQNRGVPGRLGTHPREAGQHPIPETEGFTYRSGELPRPSLQEGPIVSGGGRGRLWFSAAERNLDMGLIFLILLVLLLVGAFPTWPHSRNWGYYPSGGLGLLLLVLVILMFTGNI